MYRSLLILAKNAPLYPLTALCAFMGIVFLAFFGFRTGCYLYLSGTGETAYGQVLDVTRQTGINQRGVFLRVEYEADGHLYSGRRHSLSSSWIRGERIAVVYDPENPSNFVLGQELRSRSHWKQSIGMSALGLVLVLLAFPHAVRWLIQSHNLTRLSVRGRRLIGQVTAIKKRPYKYGSRQPLYLEYTFKGMGSSRQKGFSENIPQANEKDFEVGGVLTVLQDPEIHTRHMADVWGLSLYSSHF